MYKRGDFYWVKIYRKGKKPLFQSLGKDKKLAKMIEAKLRVEIHEGTFFDIQKGKYLTVTGLLDIYREKHAVPHKQIETVKTDFYLGKAIIRLLGELYITDVTPAHLEGYIECRTSDGVTSTTIHRELNLLRHAYSLAIKKWDFIKETPFVKIQLPKGYPKRIRYLKPEEIVLLFEGLKDNDWLRSVVIVARETGLRLSNICNLVWDQVNLFQRFIEVEKTKNGKPVWIPMSDTVFEVFMRLNKRRNLTSNRVFIVKGKTLHRNWVSNAFRKVCRRVGVENFRFHDLRHDFCSRLVQAGQPLHVVAELAGHENIATTRGYAHLSPDNKREAINALNGTGKTV